MPASQDRPRDEGTSLVEVVAALGITAVVLLALLSSAVFALSSTVEARQEQQAGDYLNQALEQARTLDFAALTMRTAEVAGAQGVVTVGGVPSYDAGSGPEPVASSATGLVTPHAQTASTSNGTYTTRRWVTVPASAVLDVHGQPSLRRVVVEVSWTTKGKTRVRRSSTLVTLTRRGLPLPAFTWAYTGPAVVVSGVPTWVKNPGNEVDYGFVLQNQGARESWTLSASTPGWAWYRDTDRDGLWSGDPVAEPPLTGASTGTVEPGAAPVNVVAFRVIGAGESGTSTTTFTATPASDPTGTRSVTTRLTVQSGAIAPPTSSPAPTASPTGPPAPCNPGPHAGTASPGTVPAASAPSSYTLQSLSLYKSVPGGAPGDATATASATMGRDQSALEPALCNWSTDLHPGSAGRRLNTATSPGTTATQLDWRFQPANRKQDDYAGTPVVTLWVQCTSGTPSLTVSLLSLSGSTPTTRATTTMGTPACSGTTFTRYSAALPALSAFGIGLTDSLVLRVTSSSPVRLGYGATPVPASLVIGMK